MPSADAQPGGGQATWQTDPAAAHAEALRRIAALIEQGGDTLDLSDLPALEALPPELAAATTLRRLFAGDFDAQGRFNLPKRRLSDVAALAGLTALTTLDLSGTQITTPPDLAGLTALTTLDLSGTPITTPPDLSGLTALAVLDLTGTAITTPPDLTGLTALARIRLGDTRITTSPDFTGLTALVRLGLNNTLITSPPDLAGLSNLDSLGLEGTRITTPPELDGLTALSWLDLSGTGIKDLSFLLSAPRFAAEEGEFLRFENTPAADQATDRRLYMLSRLPPDRCAVETVQYLKGTHPDYHGRPEGAGQALLAQRLAEASPVDVVPVDGRLDAVNRGTPRQVDPVQRAQRVAGLRTQVAMLRAEAPQTQCPPRLIGRLESYAEGLETDAPVFFVLDAAMDFIRASVADDYLMDGLDAGLRAGFRSFVARHDELAPFLLPPPEGQAAAEAALPALDASATPEDLADLTDQALEVVNDPDHAPFLGDQMRQTLKAVEELALVARDRLEERPGLLRRGFVALGGTLQVLSNAVTAHGWLIGPGAAMLATQLAPILQAVLRAFGG